MRIAHVITRLIIGGAQENTILNCEDLMRLYGDEVLLISGPTYGPEGSLVDRVRGGGLPLEVVPSLRREIHPLHDVSAYFALKRAFREFRPDVVHTHSAKAGILGRAAARKVGVPAIVHGVHGAPFYPYQNPLVRHFYRVCERWAARRCDAMVSVADAMTDLMVEGDVAPRDRFRTIYSGMETENFLRAREHRERVRAEFGFRDEHVVVGKIARLFHLKGHEYVVEAASSIIEKNPKVRFFFVGDGLLANTLKRQIEARGLTDFFHFAGLVPPARIPEMLSAMDMVVHASLREGLARVLPQALLAGIPAISYDIDGAREVVVTDRTGILLPPKSVEPLAEAVLRLADDAALREKLGKEGRRRCETVFAHQYMTKKIRELYEELLERNNPRHADPAPMSRTVEKESGEDDLGKETRND